MLRQIPDTVLDLRVTGVHLVPGTLRDQLRAGPELLVFLRHFGCMFCRETLGDLRVAAETVADFPPVLFFFQGSPTEGRAFLRRYWPDARAVADAEKRFYVAFGVERGSVLQLFGPGVWAAKRRAEGKGHENGEREGDIWMMPGAFLVDGASVLWAHQYRHAADHPDFAQLPALVRGETASPGAP
jgi:hypothetical protein